jgi:putative ABC transport system permease protein
LNQFTFHVTILDLVSFAIISAGLTFIAQLWFAKKANQPANRFLAIALTIIVLNLVRMLAINTSPVSYFRYWNWLPLQYSLAFGPIIFFYVLISIHPGYKFRRIDYLHFSPLLVQLVQQVSEIKMSIGLATTTNDVAISGQMNLAIRLLTLISVFVYLYKGHWRIYLLFYLVLAIAVVTGICLSLVPWYPELRYYRPIRILHEMTMYFVLAFTWVHLIGVLRAERKEQTKGIVSAMINGGT